MTIIRQMSRQESRGSAVNYQADEQAGVARQGSLVCCSPWGHKDSDATEQIDNSLHSTEAHGLRRGQTFKETAKLECDNFQVCVINAGTKWM